MKVLNRLVAALVLMSLAVMTGCEDSQSNSAPADVTGTWSGVLSKDNSEEASPAVFTLAQSGVIVSVLVEFGDPALFGGSTGWGTPSGVYSESNGILVATTGNDQLELTFSGSNAVGTLVLEFDGSFNVALTKM